MSETSAERGAPRPQDADQGAQVEPGFTRTGPNGNTGVQTVEEGAEIIVRTARVGPGGPTGGYFGAHGPAAW